MSLNLSIMGIIITNMRFISHLIGICLGFIKTERYCELIMFFNRIIT